MDQRLTPTTVMLLILPTMLWAGNAVVGKLVYGLIPPITLNFIRWLLAFFILCFFAREVLSPKSALWSHWRYYALLGVLGVGLDSALQCLLLQRSSASHVGLFGVSLQFR